MLLVVVLVAVIVGAVLIFQLTSIPHAQRTSAAHRAYLEMPAAARREVISTITSHTSPYRTSPVRTVHVPLPVDEQRISSQLGGHPYLESDDHWPRDEKGKRAPFLGQVLLAHPSLPNTWHGRMLVFFTADPLEGVRMYRAPSAARAVAFDFEPEEPRVALTAISTSDDPEEVGLASALFAEIPGLERTLGAYHSNPELLLLQIMTGGERSWYEPDVLEAVPNFLQDDIVPGCRHCREPMRFLAQMPAGECTLYAFGCDTHDDEIEADVQCA